MVLVLAVIVSQSVRPAHALTVSTFVGTTYTNEHFSYEIGPQTAVVYDLSGSLLIQKMSWSVEKENFGSWVQVPNGTLTLLPPSQQWLFMNWTSGPFLNTQQVGLYNRVAASGVMNGSLAVTVYYTGLSLGNSSMGPKISVRLQSLSGYGVYRLHWHLQGIQPNIFSIENRNGTIRTPIYGPVTLPGTFVHAPAGENSLVALASDQATILFGMNWQDAIQNYRGLLVSKSSFGSVIDASYGDFSLGLGQSAILDPVFEGGGGGGGAPAVSISGVSVSGPFGGNGVAADSLNGDTATITWSTNPSNACDQVQWGTTTSYGNSWLLPCGTHTVTLPPSTNYANLVPHTTYYYQIISSAVGYSSNTYSSSFYTTDISLSWGVEAYGLSAGSYTTCGDGKTYSVPYTVRAQAPGDIVTNVAKAGDTTSFQTWDFDVQFTSSQYPFPNYCWSYGLQGIGIYDSHIDLWIYDYPNQQYNWANTFAGPGDQGFITSSSSSSNQYNGQFSISVGAGYGPFQASLSYTFAPASITSSGNVAYQNTIVNGGWEYLGWIDYQFPSSAASVSYQAISGLVVHDYLAQYRLYDQFLLRVGYTNYASYYGGAGWWPCTPNPPPSQCQIGAYSIYLGDGDHQLGGTILDQYTSVQNGQSSGPPP